MAPFRPLRPALPYFPPDRPADCLLAWSALGQSLIESRQRGHRLAETSTPGRAISCTTPILTSFQTLARLPSPTPSSPVSGGRRSRSSQDQQLFSRATSELGRASNSGFYHATPGGTSCVTSCWPIYLIVNSPTSVYFAIL